MLMRAHFTALQWKSSHLPSSELPDMEQENIWTTNDNESIHSRLDYGIDFM